ncbi:MAG TPA: hypothetical protein VK045_03620 [Ornithinicoccus sp.]|nr:hypothetical protein [Ornithinicoccus sp.]
MRTTKIAPIACLVLVLGACGSQDPADTTTPAAPTTTSADATSAAPTTTDSATSSTTSEDPTTTDDSTTSDPATTGDDDGAEGSGCTPGEGPRGYALPDGEWFGLVKSTSDSEVEFDLACWFTGDAAAAAAAEDGEESPPPNDYYVRNRNDRTRDLPVAADATVTFYRTGDPQSEEEGDFHAWVHVLDERGNYFGIWLVMESGEVVSIEEQWVP